MSAKLHIVVRHAKDGSLSVCGDGHVFIGDRDRALEIQSKLRKNNPGEIYEIYQAEPAAIITGAKKLTRGRKSAGRGL